MSNPIWEAHINDRFERLRKEHYVIRTALDKTASWGFSEETRLKHVVEEVLDFHKASIKVEDLYTIVMHTEYVKFYLYGIDNDGGPTWCENPISAMEFEGQDKAERMKAYLDQPHICVEPLE